MCNLPPSLYPHLPLPTALPPSFLFTLISSPLFSTSLFFSLSLLPSFNLSFLLLFHFLSHFPLFLPLFSSSLFPSLLF